MSTTCKECGVTIQESTAARTGGKCMVCHNGGGGGNCIRCGRRVLYLRENKICNSCHLEENPPTPSNSRFSPKKMLKHSIEAIKEFAADHQEETFYAFSIDANMLCTNSEECFRETLQKYQSQYENYSDPAAIEDLKMNTGDWEYQGFFDLEEEHGFSDDRYQDHYDLSQENNPKSMTSSYWKAMNQLLKSIEESGVLNELKRTADFKIFVSDHE